jgi:uncharacterized membrane protein
MSSVDEIPQSQKQREGFLDRDRLIMLCDGIFAIAITLLVLDIKLPVGHLNEAQFNDALPDLFSKAIFYLITFVAIAGFWLEHHRLMQSVTSVNSRFTWLTFLFLAFIAFFPATSNIIEGYGYVRAVIIYTLGFAGCGFSLLFLWFYASWHHRLVNKELSQEDIIFHSTNLAFAPTYFSLSLLLLLLPIKPADIFWSWLLLPVVVYGVRRLNAVKFIYQIRVRLFASQASQYHTSDIHEKSGGDSEEIR